ncbi:MAG: hypothetical protein L6R38_000893 [Xanthoria sp. 2 TBL-2021]|nr:MAG: hypothetical protein L6R38_000893 [Xanthoria sp. 2 TBL-2021]
MHLEGSLSPNLLLILAQRNDIGLPSSEDDPAFASPDALLERYAHFTSLDDFLHYYFIGMSTLVTARDFEELAWERDLEAGVLAGIGLDSSEKGVPPSGWQAIYKEAKDLKINRTAHAGEEGPVEYIREAVEKLDVERIDHGIRLAEDGDLMREVAKRRIMVTLCPLSNVRLQCVERVAELPIRQFLDAGVPFSVNSDDPAYFGGYILDNYCAVQEAFSLTLQESSTVATTSIVQSWCGESRKSAMLSQLNEVIEAHTSKELR